MRLATWNVNSLKARLGRVEAFIAEHEPDVLVLQETKLADEAFPSMAFAALGYESAHHGDGRWNGVAVLSRVGLESVRGGFSDEEPGAQSERRLISASCGGVRVLCVYVPNGRVVDSEHYLAKLDWLAHLRRELDATCDPAEAVVVAGDFNIAPGDDDVFDVSRFVGATHVTEPERAALSRILEWGLEDVVRTFHAEGPGPFSWWDYRAGAFHKGEGMRIDLALCSRPLAARVSNAWIDREARKGLNLPDKPSDHAPVVLEIDD